ncbi:hypothetical protein [Priestia flexa]|uniref:Uncharacterized protein n=1 Tax=Priestia flexa TaxID=86664 RepID=A0ABU4J2Z3_9BACI|nr:hypothetical protein [Priestia flexa]MBY6087125.1 hypothetical protein [Priestia flexa]MCG7314170.1 hypothetical protein [Priestia flexa]MDW8515358.1 hypothetical protein [Priestia flexa]MED4590722.1 hypothetical protein [Priestia flexa]
MKKNQDSLRVPSLFQTQQVKGFLPTQEACDWNEGCETPTGLARQIEIPQERSDEEVQH